MSHPSADVPAAARPGAVPLRPAPAGLADPNLQPPAIAESGDPFALVRILELVARLGRGQAIRIDDIAAALNVAYLDWTFAPAVVLDALVGLQANWLSDYRNGSGIVLADGPLGASITIEDSSRVDPSIVRQVQRAADACNESLRAFSRRSGTGFDD
ncbi:MAG TPA: hypothetical protein VKR24_09550 [Candidatus Limnocylindrales bacterium]|nr:hypothetical protein [Candidatus Limnocylindrales bacterium]